MSMKIITDLSDNLVYFCAIQMFAHAGILTKEMNQSADETSKRITSLCELLAFQKTDDEVVKLYTTLDRVAIKELVMVSKIVGES
jgi:hypothetical protein